MIVLNSHLTSVYLTAKSNSIKIFSCLKMNISKLKTSPSCWVLLCTVAATCKPHDSPQPNWYAILYDQYTLRKGKYFIAQFYSVSPGQHHWEGLQCPHHSSPLQLPLLPFAQVSVTWKFRLRHNITVKSCVFLGNIQSTTHDPRTLKRLKSLHPASPSQRLPHLWAGHLYKDCVLKYQEVILGGSREGRKVQSSRSALH